MFCIFVFYTIIKTSTKRNVLIYFNDFIQDYTYISVNVLDREIKLFAPNQLLNWRVYTFFKKNLKILNVWIILKKRKFNFF